MGLSGIRWKSLWGFVEVCVVGLFIFLWRFWFRRFFFESIEILDLDIDYDIVDELEIFRMYEDGI